MIGDAMERKPRLQNKPYTRTSLCEICGREATHTCRQCNRRVCDRHYDFSAGLCTACALKIRNKLAGASKVNPADLGVCAVCMDVATHICKLCKRHVCDKHFDKNLDICVMCRIRKERDDMKMNG